MQASKPSPSAATAAPQEDVPVRAVDQANISEFSLLATRLPRLDAKLAELTASLESLEDAETEAMLADGPGAKRVAVAEAFVAVSDEDFDEFVRRKRDEWTAERRMVEESKREVQERMGALKTELYARFGTQIALEL